MLKRQASGPKPARKKKKGNATYTSSSLDPSPEDKLVAENIRVWNLSTSETTGRVKGTRKTHKHYYQASPGPSVGPSTSEKPDDEGTAGLEDPGFLADSESPPEAINKRRPKRSRVRVIKQNDSVSGNHWLCSPGLFVLPDQDGRLAPVPPGLS